MFFANFSRLVALFYPPPPPHPSNPFWGSGWWAEWLGRVCAILPSSCAPFSPGSHCRISSFSPFMSNFEGIRKNDAFLRKLRSGNFSKKYWVLCFLGHIRHGHLQIGRRVFFVFLCKTTLWNIFHKLPQQGCFQDDEMYSKMMFTTFFGHFVVILVMYSSILATNLHSKNVTFATKRPIFLRGPFLSFPSTPTR